MTSTRSGFQRRIAREGGDIHTNEGEKAAQGKAGMGREKDCFLTTIRVEDQRQDERAQEGFLHFLSKQAPKLLPVAGSQGYLEVGAAVLACSGSLIFQVFSKYSLPLMGAHTRERGGWERQPGRTDVCLCVLTYMAASSHRHTSLSIICMCSQHTGQRVRRLYSRGGGHIRITA
jgi:hypothetical protein